MSHEPVPLPHATWMDCFTKNALRKGYDYSDRGEVLACTVSDDRKKIEAAIQGGEPEPCEVEAGIKIDDSGRGFIDGFCTCSVEYNCKHVAAAVFAALEKAPDLFGKAAPPVNGRAAAQPVPRPVQPALPTEFEQWLKRLEFAARPAGVEGEKAAQQKHCVLYLLTIEHRSGGPALVVNWNQARRVKSGGFGAIQPYSAYNVLSPKPARFVLAADIRIARRLIGVSDAFGRFNTSSSPLDGEDAAEVLQRVLDTGRCY